MSGKTDSPASSNRPPPPGEWWLCFAVRPEAAFVPRTHCPVLLTGMGAETTRRFLLPRLQSHRPGLLFTCGFAGALNPELPVGTVLMDADESFPLKPSLLRAGARPATFHPVDRVVIHAREKAKLQAQTGADAVEMESHVIRRLCQERGIPSATLRAISDAAGEDMPLDFNRLLTPDQRLSLPRLFLALLADPSRLGGLLQLRRQCRLAARRLADTLQAVLPSSP